MKRKCRHVWDYIGYRPHTVLMLRATIRWCKKCGALKWDDPDEGAKKVYLYPKATSKED